MPHFERTLSLFRQVAHSNLRDVPPEYLNVVADDAEKTLARFREILSFTGEGVQDPKEVSAAMISAVRDAYEPIYEKLSPIIKAPVSEPEVVRKPKRRFALAIGVAIAVLAAAIVGSHFAGYHYAQYTVFAEQNGERVALKLPALRQGWLLFRRQTRSIIDAIPCPTPIHIVHSS